MGFMDKTIASRIEDISLVVAPDATGREAWYFLWLDRGKEKAFDRLGPNDACDLRTYGKILDCGYGSVPPEKAVQALKSRLEAV